MAYAPHNNTEVHHQIVSGIVPSDLPMILGAFREKDYGHVFEYAERRWPDDEFHPELPHIIFVGDVNTQPRLAKVLKTVAYVLTGEGEIQKWQLGKHNAYETQWVGRPRDPRTPMYDTRTTL